MSIALFLALTLPLAQSPVFRCTGPAGAVSYQDVPCAKDHESVEVALPPVPAYVPAPTVNRVAESRGDLANALPPQIKRTQARSWRCLADNGEVFYRHAGCPATISMVMLDPYAQAYANTGLVFVESIPIPRSEACAAINSGGRFGSERDQRAEPYEKLTGRDLCR